MTDASRAQPFVDQGLIRDIIRPIKTGKEATVLLCRANPRTAGTDLAAVKIFHPRHRRDFKDESTYRAGEWIPDRRIAKAVAQKTRFGRQIGGVVWVEREYQTMRHLHAGGVAVPRPIARSGDAVLMTYVGEMDAPAPQLRSHRPSGPEETAALLDQALAAAARMLRLDTVHADLSPYNLLLHEGRLTVIDLPQAVDPRRNPFAEELFFRDVRRLCEWGGRHGVDRDAGDVAAAMWGGWQLADLVPDELRHW